MFFRRGHVLSCAARDWLEPRLSAVDRHRINLSVTVGVGNPIALPVSCHGGTVFVSTHREIIPAEDALALIVHDSRDARVIVVQVVVIVIRAVVVTAAIIAIRIIV